MRDWKNRITREVYVAVLEEWVDPLAEARQWLEMGSGSAVELLARRVRRRYYRLFARLDDPSARVHDPFTAAAYRMVLKLVDWSQVAERLLARAMPLEDEEEGEPEEGGGEATASA